MTDTQHAAIIHIIQNRLGYDDNYKINSNDRLSEDLNSDSLDTVEILMDCEKEFWISISDDAIESIVTVQDVIDAVENCLQNANP